METPSLGFDNTMSMGAFLDDLYAKDAAEQAKIQEKLMKKKPKHYRRPNSGPGLGTAKGEKLKATGRASKRPAQEQPAECGPAESTSSPADVGVRKCTHCASTTSGNGRWVKSSLVTGQLRCNACYWYERKRGKIRPLQWDDQQCAKCHKALPKSAGRYSGSDLLCRKCYDYEDAKSPAQEQSAECESASSPTDVGVRKCSHCASTTSSNGRWVKSLLANGQIRCNTCYWYEKKRGKLRPLRRDDQQCAKCHKVLLKQAGRYHDKAEGGSVLLCRKCYDYEDLEHHAQEQSTERGHIPTLSTTATAASEDPVVQCGNCLATTTSKNWGTSRLETGQNSSRCKACAMYEYRHGKARPLDLKCTKCGIVILKRSACYSIINPKSLICRACCKSEKLASGNPSRAKKACT